MTQEEKAFEPDPSSHEDVQNEIDLNDVESLQQALAAEKERSDKYLGNWQRSQADFSNFKKRSESEKAENIKFANSLLMGELLPIIDDFERALENIPEELKGHSWVEGIDLIYQKITKTLEGHGLSVIEVEGKDFDPNYHQAVFYEEGGEEGKVVADLQKGYMLHDRLLRPSMVKVGKSKDG